MHPSVVAAVFPVIFIGELPDKTMFATVVMASRGHPRAVWLGAAGAFGVHVVIAATVGVGLVHLLPHRAVEALVAGLFAAGAVLVLRESDAEELELVEREARSHHRVATTAFAVIFVAEWGDLTQILIANLAAHGPGPVGGGRHRRDRRAGRPPGDARRHHAPRQRRPAGPAGGAGRLVGRAGLTPPAAPLRRP